MSFEFFLREGWTGFRRSGIMSLVSLVTVTVSLVVFGFFMLAIFNLENIAHTIGSKMEVVAYVDKGIDDYTANTFVIEISKIDGVDTVKYIPKEQAWGNFKKDFEGRLSLAEIVRENPLPNTFVVKVKTPQMVSPVAKKIANMPQMDEVRYSGNLADRFQKLLEALQFGGLVLVLLLIIATLLIVVNTVKLTVIARQTDISIMKLVGATNSFIKWPFIIEGILIGVIGSAFAFIILKFSYDIISFQIQSALPFVPIITSKMQLFWIYASVCGLGTILGMAGAYLSVNSLLKEII